MIHFLGRISGTHPRLENIDIAPSMIQRGTVYTFASRQNAKTLQSEVRKLKGKTLVQDLRRQEFQVAGPKLWNCLPKNVRNFRGNQVDFKQTLDQFLSKVPDEPKTDGLIPGAVDGLNGKQTNTLIYQVARRKVPWKDDDLVLAATTTGDPNGL